MERKLEEVSKHGVSGNDSRNKTHDAEVSRADKSEAAERSDIDDTCIEQGLLEAVTSEAGDGGGC